MENRKSVVMMRVVKMILILFTIHYSLFTLAQKREMRGAWIQCVN